MPDIDTLAKIGQLLSGISLAFAALAAWTTFIFYYRKERNNKWIDGFRILYNEFWKDPDITEARKWATNDELYDTILKPVLEARLATEKWKNTLTPAQNDVLEKLDLLCSALVMIKSFGDRHMTRRQKMLFSKLIDHGGSPAPLIKRGRTDLLLYVERHWNELLK